VSTVQTIDAANPKFGPPQFLGPADYHLPATSVAIDSGDPLTATLPTEDFDGAPRPVDGNGDGTARRDMGAYEYQPPLPQPGQPAPAPQAPVASGFGPEPLVTLALARKRIGAAEPLRIRVFNRNAFPVTGRLRAETIRSFATTSRLAPIRLRGVPLQVGANGTATARMALPRRLQDLLAAKGKLALRFVARLTDPIGGSRVLSQPLVPKLADRAGR
jgi:hypothetical protein